MASSSPEASPELFDELEVDVENAEANGEIVIIGADECPNCGAVKKLFEEELAEGGVRYVNIESDEGKAIDVLFGGIEAVPFVAYHDKQKHRYTKCDLAPEGDNMEDAVWTIACDVKSEEKTRVMPVG